MRTIFILFTVIFSQLMSAQEGLKPLSCNINYFYGDLAPQKKESANTASQKAPSLFLPFLDDFYYASTSRIPSKKLWSDSLSYINTGFPVSPPSIGVATFDGLNANGYPYYNPAVPNLSSSGPADTLTSMPINLFVTSNSQTLQPTDQVGFSFYYQARGYGEPPESIDSLLLDFYNPTLNKWINKIWFKRGNSNPNTFDTLFKRVFIPIKNPDYFKDGFRFRFRNKATNTGNFDHWHIDYVYLNQGRDSLLDTLLNDVTFAAVPTSFLKEYTAMPYNQYTQAEMATSNTVLLKNNNVGAVNIKYEAQFIDKTLSPVYTYSAQSNNIDPYMTNGYMNVYAFSNPASHPNFTYKYPYPMLDTQDFKIKHYVFRSGLVGDFNLFNDTVVQEQKFRNYYAYDDGAAEAGYYVLGANGRMAVKIRLAVADTLRAVRIYFDPAPVGTAANFNFKIQVWSGASAPTNTVAMPAKLYYPQYLSTGFKDIPEYVLDEPLLLQPGTYFVGIQQQLSTGLVVGFDRNPNASQNLYYDSGAGWTKSGFPGALMMRPVMGPKIQPPVGILENDKLKQNIFSVYPNPSENSFTITNEKFIDAEYKLVNALGQQVLAGRMTEPSEQINTENISTGIYILMISTKGKAIEQQKIIIQK